jgi:hypothetical protein
MLLGREVDARKLASVARAPGFHARPLGGYYGEETMVRAEPLRGIQAATAQNDVRRRFARFLWTGDFQDSIDLRSRATPISSN